MTTVTWAQLTPDERALLDKLARALLAGDEWVQTPETLDGISQGEYGELLDTHKFIEWNPLNTRFKWLGERITPAGLAVWQQGQAASAPRSVWVAEKGVDEDRDILSVHTTEAGAKAACQRDWEQHIETRSRLNYPKTITWKQFDGGGDGSGYYVSQSGPYYVGQYPLVDDAE